MKQTYILAGALILSLLAYFIFANKNKTSSLDSKEAAFSVKDTNAITKIRLAEVINNVEKYQIMVEKNAAGKWLIGNKYNALEPQIALFFKTISQLKVREVLTDKGNESADAILTNYHVKVEIFDKKGVMKAYDLGQEGKDHIGSLMRMANAKTAYIVEIPGFQGYLNGRFPLQLQAWEENLLFEWDYANIQSIDVKFKDKNKSSFSIKRAENNTFSLNGKMADSSKVNRYLRQYKGKVYAETFANADFPGKKDELKTQTPDVVLNISYKDGNKKTIVLFLRPDNNNNSYFGWIEGDTELLTVQHFVVNRFLSLENPLLLWSDRMKKE